MEEPTLNISVEFTAGEDMPELPIFLEITDPDFDPLTIDLTLTDDALNAGSEPVRVAGLFVQIDTGAGLQTIPLSQLGSDATIVESLDAEADTLTFSRAGRDWAPFRKAVLRAKRDIAAFFTYGKPGSLYTEKVFSGSLTLGSFDGDSATVTALDAAINFSQRRGAINLPRAHGKKLREVLVDFCAEYGITIGGMDLGPIAEIPRKKPIVLVDTPLIDIAKAIVSPARAKVWFADGKLYAMRYDADAPIMRILYPRDYSSIDTSLPDTAATNTAEAIAIFVDETDPVAKPVRISIVETTSNYARKGAIYRRGDGTGPVDFSEAPTLRVTERIVSKVWYLGDTAVRSEQWRYGYMARPVADRQINTDETIEDYVPFIGSIYQYEDGNWYADDREVFRLIEVIVHDLTVDDDFKVTAETNYQYGWHFIRRPIFNEADTLPFASVNPILITKDGIGVLYEAQHFGNFHDDLFGTSGYTPSDLTTVTPLAKVEAVVEADADGLLTSRTTTTTEYSLGAQVSSSSNYGYSYDVLRVQRYQYSTEAPRVTVLTEEVFTPEENPQNGFTAISTTTAVGKDPVATITPSSGQREAQTVIQPEAESSELRHTSRDALRIAMNGEHLLQIHTEFCETLAELEIVTKDALREAAAYTIQIPMPIEGGIHKGYTITATARELGMDGVRLFVYGVTRQFGAKTQTVETKYYPEEVA